MERTLTIKIAPKLEEKFLEKCESLKLDISEVVNKLIERFVDDHSLIEEEEFAEGLTVGEYFNISEEEKDALWAKWERIAEKEIEV